MSNITNPLDILKRLDVKQNVTIRVIDEPTGKVVQEHIGHNAATNSLLTGIAHYLMGDGVLNQGADTLSMWVPQYISLGTMGLTSQESEIYTASGDEYIVPAALGYTPMAPANATAEEKKRNMVLRFTEYLNQTPGFGADGYDDNSNNDREWFGLGYPYTLKPDALAQDFYTWDGTAATFELSKTPIDIISVTLFEGGIVDQDPSHINVSRQKLASDAYSLSGNVIHLDPYDPEAQTQPIPANSRLAVIYTYKSADAANCELIKSKVDASGDVIPLTLRSKVTYRNLVPEFQSEIPNTLDVIYSAMISTGALKDFRGDRDYIYITEAGLWSKPGFTDSGDNGLLAGYRLMPSDDEVNILGSEITLQSTGGAEYSLVNDDNEPLSVISIDSVTCDSTEQRNIGDGTTTEFKLLRVDSDVISVKINGVEAPSASYYISTADSTITFNDAPANEAAIVITYQNTVVPSDGYVLQNLVGVTLLTFENGYIPTAGQTMFIIYRSGDVSGTWKDMTKAENRRHVQESILRVGTNQVVQIIWKIQLGGLQQLNGLRYIYQSQYPEEVWELET